MKRWVSISIMVVLFIVSWRMIAHDADFFVSMPDVSWGHQAELVSQNKLVGISQEQLNQDLVSLINDGLAYRVEKKNNSNNGYNNQVMPQQCYAPARRARCTRSDRRRNQAIMYEGVQQQAPSVVIVQKNDDRAVKNDEQIAKNYITPSQLVPMVMTIMQRLLAEQKMVQKDQIVRLDPDQLLDLKNSLLESHKKEIAPDVGNEDDIIDYQERLEKYKRKHPLLFSSQGQLIDHASSESRAPYQLQPQLEAQPYAPQPQMHYQQPIPQQPVMYYHQPMQQNNSGQMAAAMQLQSSAMAMQMQASALMMQAQQQPQVMLMQVPMMTQAQMQYPVHRDPITVPQRKQMNTEDKQRILSEYLQQIALLEADRHRLLLLLSSEINIVENLLSGVKGHLIEQKIMQRKDLLKDSGVTINNAYELIIDLVSSQERSANTKLYNYFVNKNKKSKYASDQAASIKRKKFLADMLANLQEYYELIQKL